MQPCAVDHAQRRELGCQRGAPEGRVEQLAPKQGAHPHVPKAVQVCACQWRMHACCLP